MRPVEDLRETVRVVRRVALHYRGGADAALDRPAHVRAASGLCWLGDWLVVISDDASFIGVVDPASGETLPITLPHAPAERRQFDATRGNKIDKLDLECVVAVGPRLVAFGSDSGLAVRRQAVVVDHEGATPRVVPLPRLYEALRQTTIGSGDLNLEAAAVYEDTVVLGNRGGDTGPDGVPTVDAVVTMPVTSLLWLLDDPDGAPLPPLTWQRLELGELSGAPLHLTELEARSGNLYFAATAEATTNAYDDGVVTGSVIGLVEGAPGRYQVRSWRVVDESGAPLVAKIEGLAALPDRRGFLVAIDADDPARPSELLELTLDG